MPEFEKVRFQFINRDTGQELNAMVDPINYESSQRTIKRSESFGVFTELSSELEYSGEIAIFLNEAYLFRDIEANVIAREFRKFEDRDGEYLYSEGQFDFREFRRTENRVTIPFRQGGLNALVKAQMRNEFELQREESINGDDIGELQIQDVALVSRDVLLVSRLEATEFDTNLSPLVYFVPKVNIISESDPRVSSVFNSFLGLTTAGGQWDNALTNDSSVFFYQGTTDVFEPETKEITVSGKWNISNRRPGQPRSVLDAALIIFDENRDYNRHIVVYNEDDFIDNQFREVEFSVTFEIGRTENIAFAFDGEEGGGGGTGSFNTDWQISRTTSLMDNYLIVTEASQRQDSQSQAILMHDVGDRLMKIITGQEGKYRSKFFGLIDRGYSQDGEFSRTGITMGLWIRQFFDRRIVMSLEQFLEMTNAVFATGYSVHKVNGVEKLVHEELQYFFQNSIVIRLPLPVVDIEREVLPNYYNSKLSFGYEEAGDYEEATGLSEFNTRRTYSMPFTRVDTEYDKVIEQRADGAGKEFARRMPQMNFPDEDTDYDKDIFILDMIQTTGLALRERVWQDDFSQAPSGIFSPDTATGLRLTPRQMFERHAWFIAATLVRLQDKTIRFASSFVDTDLSTTKAGEDPIVEESDIPVNNLKRARFIPQLIRFKHPVDFKLQQQIDGFTEVMGEMIPNIFFKIEFINQDRRKETGYLMQLQPNDEGNWELLKAL